MTIEYKIKEQDYLDFQIFTASKSNRINKKKRNGWILLTIGSIFIALLYYLNNNNPLAIYFVTVAIVCGLFYPSYFKWRYKRHYKTYVKENFSKHFGQGETLEFNKDSISFKNKAGEGKIKLTEIERVNETDKHFFLQISAGTSLIIPKAELTDINELRDKLVDIGLQIIDETNWSWK